jgi:hypothetical protein
MIRRGVREKENRATPRVRDSINPSSSSHKLLIQLYYKNFRSIDDQTKIRVPNNLSSRISS